MKNKLFYVISVGTAFYFGMEYNQKQEVKHILKAFTQINHKECKINKKTNLDIDKQVKVLKEDRDKYMRLYLRTSDQNSEIQLRNDKCSEDLANCKYDHLKDLAKCGDDSVFAIEKKDKEIKDILEDLADCESELNPQEEGY